LEIPEIMAPGVAAVAVVEHYLLLFLAGLVTLIHVVAQVGPVGSAVVVLLAGILVILVVMLVLRAQMVMQEILALPVQRVTLLVGSLRLSLAETPVMGARVVVGGLVVLVRAEVHGGLETPTKR